jgi:hypothetical protein
LTPIPIEKEATKLVRKESPTSTPPVSALHLSNNSDATSKVRHVVVPAVQMYRCCFRTTRLMSRRIREGGRYGCREAQRDSKDRPPQVVAVHEHELECWLDGRLGGRLAWQPPKGWANLVRLGRRQRRKE